MYILIPVNSQSSLTTFSFEERHVMSCEGRLKGDWKEKRVIGWRVSQSFYPASPFVYRFWWIDSSNKKTYTLRSSMTSLLPKSLQGKGSSKVIWKAGPRRRFLFPDASSSSLTSTTTTRDIKCRKHEEQSLEWRLKQKTIILILGERVGWLEYRAVLLSVIMMMTSNNFDCYYTSSIYMISLLSRS